jgi:hypothetical protein
MRQQAHRQQRNHARTCAHLMAATAARGGTPRRAYSTSAEAPGPAAIARPTLELKRFRKVTLAPGESEPV